MHANAEFAIVALLVGGSLFWVARAAWRGIRAANDAAAGCGGCKACGSCPTAVPRR